MDWVGGMAGASRPGGGGGEGAAGFLGDLAPVGKPLAGDHDQHPRDARHGCVPRSRYRASAFASCTQRGAWAAWR